MLEMAHLIRLAVVVVSSVTFFHISRTPAKSCNYQPVGFLESNLIRHRKDWRNLLHLGVIGFFSNGKGCCRSRCEILDGVEDLYTHIFNGIRFVICDVLDGCSPQGQATGTGIVRNTATLFIYLFIYFIPPILS